MTKYLIQDAIFNDVGTATSLVGALFLMWNILGLDHGHVVIIENDIVKERAFVEKGVIKCWR